MRRPIGFSDTSALADGGSVPAIYLQAIWPHVRELIASACARGGAADPDEIERELFAGEALLWIANDGSKVIAAGATQLWLNGARKICSVIACGGRGFARYRHLLAMIEDYARRSGCDAVEVCGRIGWARVLDGYAVAKVIEADTSRTRRVILERKL